MIYEILNLDCRLLPLVADPGSVQTCITSPPYFGLRDYGVEGQFGLEQTPDAYVQHLVEVFRGVRELLADDGTLWLNLGDSYAGGGYSNHDVNGVAWKAAMNGDKRRSRQQDQRKALAPFGIKPKDLIGIPWRVAFALQADGWYLRQDIIWHKPNPMPESVRDRCTKAHEYIFLFSKSPRYHFDHGAIKEPEVMKPQNRLTPRKANPNAKVHAMPVYRQMEGGTGGGMKNKRSVWTVSTKPYKGAHFATFPIDLIEPCVLAGSQPGDLVLDPFSGAGTTALAALKHGRRALLCELNPKYVALAEARISDMTGLLPESRRSATTGWMGDGLDEDDGLGGDGL